MVNQATLSKVLPHYTLVPSTRSFVSYTKDRFQCLGYVPVEVTFRGRTRSLNLYVTSFETDSIFGREWISEFADLVSFEEFFKISEYKFTPNSVHVGPRNSSIKLKTLLRKYDQLFSETAGTLAGTAGTLVGAPADVTFREGVQPKFSRARQIPFALRDQFAAEIDKKNRFGSLPPSLNFGMGITCAYSYEGN